jgi:hypothetical protein
MTATQILTNKLALKCCGVFSAYSEQKQCVNGCVLTPKKASNAVSNCQIQCSFSTKIGTGKSVRTNFNRKPVSNFKSWGKSCDHSINVCFAVAIVINKLSRLSDRVCNSCWRRKVRNLFQLFHLVKNSTKEESVNSESRSIVKPCKSQSVSNRLTCNCL